MWGSYLNKLTTTVKFPFQIKVLPYFVTII